MPTMEAAQPRVTSIYRYPVKGLSAEKLPGTVLAAGPTAPAPPPPPAPHRAGARPALPGRPALRDREGPERFRPRRSRLHSEEPFPDADAQRAARPPRHPFRRTEPYAHGARGRTRGGAWRPARTGRTPGD